MNAMGRDDSWPATMPTDPFTTSTKPTGPVTTQNRVDGICGSGQIGTVKTGWVENAGVDLSARYGKGGQCGM